MAETYLVAWRRLDDVPGDGQDRPWLFGVARNVLANYYRSERRRSCLARDEIALVLRVPRATVRARLHRARRRLQHLLAQVEDAEGVRTAVEVWPNGRFDRDGLRGDGVEEIVFEIRDTLRAQISDQCLDLDTARAHANAAVCAVQADLTDPDAVLRAAEALEGRAVDVLVNNAGGVGEPPGPGLHGRFQAWRHTLDQNLLSAMMLTEALWPTLTRPGGRVITISSIAAQRGGGGAYGVAKAGLLAWSAELAMRGGRDGITANTVAHGDVAATEFFNESGRSPRHDALVSQTLLGRAGAPADVAGAVHYLALGDASWVTGQVLSVNGGAVLGR